MAITAIRYVAGRDIDTLTAAVNAAITDDDLTPFGAPVMLYNIYVQAMVAGTAPGSIEDVQAAIAALEDAVEALETEDGVLAASITRIDGEAETLVAKLNLDATVTDEDYAWTSEA